MKKASRKNNPPNQNQKVDLYFDENFPQEIIERLRSNNSWKNKYRVYSVYDFGNENKDDAFQFQFCKEKGYTLVTLDDDFLDDRTYPYNGFPGIVRIVSSRNDLDTINSCIEEFLTLLMHIPSPKFFLIDAKFKVSTESCIMRARDSLTGEIKTLTLVPGKTTNHDVMQFFHYFGI